PVENDESSTSPDGPTEGPDDSDTSGDSSASDDADERGDDSKSSSEDKDSKSSSKEKSSSDEKSSDSDDEETVPADTVWHVEAGDTLASLSAETGVIVDALVETNSIANPNQIYAVSALRFPAVGSADNTGPPVERFDEGLSCVRGCSITDPCFRRCAR